MPQRSFYFGYGSNLWINQMERRCPENTLVGIARLQGWRFVITTRGFANIVPSEGDTVFGFVYQISVPDEQSLDGYEGVPYNYSKEVMSVDLLGADGEHNEVVNALVYVDYERLGLGPPREEYVYRMNRAIEDALQRGIPDGYITSHLRRFIPIQE